MPKQNRWIQHVMEIKKKHPGKSLKAILIIAKESYKKV